MEIPMPNRRRGEVGVCLDGRPHTLRLTLNALAELEDAFGVEGLSALAARLSRPLTSRDLARILGAALRGGGHAVSDEEAGGLALDGGVEAVGQAVAEALRLAFGAGEGAPNPPPPRAPIPSTPPSAS